MTEPVPLGTEARASIQGLPIPLQFVRVAFKSVRIIDAGIPAAGRMPSLGESQGLPYPKATRAILGRRLVSCPWPYSWVASDVGLRCRAKSVTFMSLSSTTTQAEAIHQPFFACACARPIPLLLHRGSSHTPAAGLLVTQQLLLSSFFCCMVV